jgi:hypothetical protein
VSSESNSRPVKSTGTFGINSNGPAPEKAAVGEILLLGCALSFLLLSCILWSPYKQVWMDEIFTWKEVSDPSLWHLYSAIQHGADGGQSLFYVTVWTWARAFGTSVLALRLYSSIAVCGALLVTWRTIRRFYGVWATAFGVLVFWGTSGDLLDQNVEGRFYGLYLLAVAITVHLFVRLAARPLPSRSVLILAFFSQAVLVSTHIFGIIYGGLILLALVLFDAAKGQFRFRLYLAYAAGWLVLLPWIPATRSIMATGKPHGWIAMPTITDLRTAYLFADSLPWLRFFMNRSSHAGFQIVSRTAEAVIYLPLAVVLVLGVRRIWQSGWRVIADPKGTPLLLAYLLLSAPLVLFVLSHVVTPVLAPRYVLPSGIGLAIVLAAFAQALGADSQISSHLVTRLMWTATVLLLMILPVLTVLAVKPINQNLAYLDVERVEQLVPPDVPVVAGWQEDFAKFMRLAHNPGRFFFLLDWPTALQGPRTFVVDYHLMQTYRANGYYSNNIQDNRDFLCAHPDFFVLVAPNANTLDGVINSSLDLNRPNWFDNNVRTKSEFGWTVVGLFDGPRVTRKLIAVHRRGSLPFCKIP